MPVDCVGSFGRQDGIGLLGVGEAKHHLLRFRQPLLLLCPNMLELLLQSVLQPSLLLQSLHGLL